MPDFDSNEDFIRLTGAGRDDAPDPGELDRARFEPPLVRRARLQVEGHYTAHSHRLGRRVGVTLIAMRRHTTRRACPYGRRVPVLATPPRCNRRRLWTECHGRPPGSPN
jgi:hypothetical protein